MDFPGALMRSCSTVYLSAYQPRKHPVHAQKPTMLLDEFLNVPHDLAVSLMRVCCHTENTSAVLLIDYRGMRVQHKRYGQETFDPFNLESSALSLSLFLSLSHTLGS